MMDECSNETAAIVRSSDSDDSHVSKVQEQVVPEDSPVLGSNEESPDRSKISEPSESGSNSFENTAEATKENTGYKHNETPAVQYQSTAIRAAKGKSLVCDLSPIPTIQSCHQISTQETLGESSEGDSESAESKESSTAAPTLYGRLKTAQKDDVPRLATMWCNQFEHETSRSEACFALLHLLLSCAGYANPQLPHQINMKNIKRIILNATKIKQGESENLNPGEFPSMNSSQREFENKFDAFIRAVITNFSNTATFKEHLFPFVCNVGEAFTQNMSSKVRHTGAVLVLLEISTLFQAAEDLSRQVEDCEKSCEIQKDSDLVSNNRIVNLLEVEQKRSINVVMNCTKYLLNNSFQLLIRDVNVKIVILGLQHLNTWLLKYPDILLNPKILAHIRHAFVYPSPEVRFVALKCLLSLLMENKHSETLQTFYLMIKELLHKMTADKNKPVVQVAIEIMTEAISQWPDIVPQEHQESIYKLVYSKHKWLSQAAGQFVYNRIKFLAEDDVHFFVLLSEFHIESLEQEKHINMLVDAIFIIDNEHSILENWSVMIKILLMEKIHKKYNLQNTEVLTVHTQIVAHLVRKACTGQSQINTGSAFSPLQVTSKKPSTLMCEIRSKMTNIFIQYMPQLIRKFEQQTDILIQLVSIPQCFCTEPSKDERNDDYVLALVEEFERIMMTAEAEALLRQVFLSLEALCSCKIYRCASIPACNRLRTSIIKTYCDSAKGLHDLIEENKVSTEAVIQWGLSLKRILVLQQCSAAFTPTNEIFHGLRSFMDFVIQDRLNLNSQNVLSEVLVNLVRVCALLCKPMQSIDDDSINSLVEEARVFFLPYFYEFIKNLRDLMARFMAFVAVMRCYPIIYHTSVIPEKEEDIITNFMNECVFVDDNTHPDERSMQGAAKRVLQKSRAENISFLIEFASRGFGTENIATCIFFSQMKFPQHARSFDKALQKRLVLLQCIQPLLLTMLKELSKRFSPDNETKEALKQIEDVAKSWAHIVALVKSKVDEQDLLNLHIEGVDYCFGNKQSENPLIFLQILGKFSYLLSEKQHQEIIKHLGRKISNVQTSRERNYIKYYLHTLNTKKRFSHSERQTLNALLKKLKFPVQQQQDEDEDSQHLSIQQEVDDTSVCSSTSLAKSGLPEKRKTEEGDSNARVEKHKRLRSPVQSSVSTAQPPSARSDSSFASQASSYMPGKLHDISHKSSSTTCAASTDESADMDESSVTSATTGTPPETASRQSSLQSSRLTRRSKSQRK